MASSKWKTFSELESIISKRNFVFWGASNWIERTMESLSNDPLFVIDKSKLNRGIKHNNFDVFNPEDVDFSKKPFVIISTVNYMSVIDDLEDIGYVMGEDYCCTPLLNVRKDKDDIQNIDQKILVSSSQHFFDKKSGGGLYEVDLKTLEISKLYSGKGRGICKTDDYYFLIDMLRGIIILDKKFKELSIIDLQKNSEPHGICYDSKRNWILVGQPGRDSIAAYDVKTKELVNEFFISKKWERNKKDNHHVNDPFVLDDTLYISMFSFSGNWLNEVYDGGVMEIDIETGEILGTPLENLWMPHSVGRYKGKLTVLNSMMGELLSGSYDKVTKLNGFARGLCFDDKYYYIGITEHRYPEKLYGISKSIGVDTGLSIVEPNTKLSRFISMSHVIESIHSVIIK